MRNKPESEDYTVDSVNIEGSAPCGFSDYCSNNKTSTDTKDKLHSVCAAAGASQSDSKVKTPQWSLYASVFMYFNFPIG